MTRLDILLDELKKVDDNIKQISVIKQEKQDMFISYEEQKKLREKDKANNNIKVLRQYNIKTNNSKELSNNDKQTKTSNKTDNVIYIKDFKARKK